MKKSTKYLLIPLAVIPLFTATTNVSVSANVNTNAYNNFITASSDKVVSGKDIGLVADNKTDNTKALNDWLATTDNNKSSTLKIEEGKYHFKGNVLMHSNVNIEGVPGKTEFIADAKVSFHYPSPKKGYDGGVHDVKWSGIKFTGTYNPDKTPAIISYPNHDKLIIDTKGLANNNQQTGRAYDGVSVKTGQDYTMKMTYKTDDDKSQKVIMQASTGDGHYVNQTFDTVNDGQEHTVEFKITPKGKNITFYYGHEGNFKGTISNVQAVSTDSPDKSLIDADMTRSSHNTTYDDDSDTYGTKGWRTWISQPAQVKTHMLVAENEKGEMLTNGVSSSEFTQSMIHAKNVTFDNVEFENAQQTGGHLLDIDGSSNIKVTNSTFKGFGNRNEIFDMNKEAIQLDFAKKSDASYSIASDQFDGLATKNVTVTNNEFLPIKDKDGVITSYAPNPIGQHVTPTGDADVEDSHIHDINFSNNHVLDVLPASKDYLAATTKGIVYSTRDVEPYAMHAPLHFPNIDKLKIDSNLFENDNINEVSSDGYIRISNWNKNKLNYSDINVTNNVFRNLKVNGPTIDFSSDGARNDIEGTVFDKTNVSKNSFVNGKMDNPLVRLNGTNRDTGEDNNFVTVKGTAENNKAVTHKAEGTSELGEKVYYDKDGQIAGRITINYVDQKTKKVIDSDELIGKNGQDVDYSPDNKLKDNKLKDYELVSSNLPKKLTFKDDQTYSITVAKSDSNNSDPNSNDDDNKDNGSDQDSKNNNMDDSKNKDDSKDNVSGQSEPDNQAGGSKLSNTGTTNNLISKMIDNFLNVILK